jgi:hypothetical protein
MNNYSMFGELVRLTAENPDVMGSSFSRWNQDVEWFRFLDTDPPRLPSEKKWREWLEKGVEKGTDAMRVMLRYVFNELNLRRVSLIVFEYNLRAIRSYEKVGFVHEGRVRRVMQRDGRRWDFLYMGILREEWLVKGILTS